MSVALMTRDDGRRVASFNSTAEQMREEAIAASSVVGAVRNEEEQAVCVAAQQGLRGVIKLAEDARKACKDPILEFGKQIDAVAKAFKAPLENEEVRLATMVGNFQQAQLAAARAAEAAHAKELQEVERKRQAELAQAQTLEQRDAINTRADLEVQAAAPPIVPVQAKGQIVREDWEIERIQEFVLAKARPDLVRKIEFDMVGIKAALNAGEKLPGVLAKKTVTSTVRAKQPLVLQA